MAEKRAGTRVLGRSGKGCRRRACVKQILKWLQMPTEILLDSFDDDALSGIGDDKWPSVFWETGSLHDLIHRLFNELGIV